jgi:hypothetical protein
MNLVLLVLQYVPVHCMCENVYVMTEAYIIDCQSFFKFDNAPPAHIHANKANINTNQLAATTMETRMYPHNLVADLCILRVTINHLSIVYCLLQVLE